MLATVRRGAALARSSLQQQHHHHHRTLHTTTIVSRAGSGSVVVPLIERKIPIKCGPNHIDATTTTHPISIVQAGRLPPAEASATVLLMPGALGSAWTDFRPQLERLPALLPDTWSVVAWDPPGYGASRPPQREFPVDFFERDARAAGDLMTALGCERFSVLGWSDGGITAMVLAAQRPHAVERLVVWGANSYALPEELRIYESIRDVQKWSAKMRQPLEQIYGVEGFARLWGEWIDGLQRIAAANDGDICSKRLADIECATLVVHGAKDPMIAGEHVPYLREHIKRTEYFEFADGKHNVHLRYAEEFNRVVAEFLQQKN